MCDRVDENVTVTVNGNKAMVTVDGNTRKESQKKKKNKERKHFGEQLWKFRRRRPRANAWERGA